MAIDTVVQGDNESSFRSTDSDSETITESNNKYTSKEI